MLELAKTIFGDSLEFGTDFIFVFFTFLLMLELIALVGDFFNGFRK